MQTNIHTPARLFQMNIRYTIPAFQRRYVWNQEDQWEPLWEDVQNTAEEYLEKLKLYDSDSIKAELDTKKHFLGAVVLKQVPTPPKEINKREVIDGQQRLTTLQLLLDAIQYVCEKKNAEGVTSRLEVLVQNNKSLINKDEEIFKLWPTLKDRLAFKHTMDNGLSVDGFQDSLIVQAHEYFQLQADQWVGSNPESVQIRMEALEAVITGMLQMVVIDLEPKDDPHMIFETLNARGTPLLESELIKNYVAMRMETSGDIVWKDLDDDWWRKLIGRGHLRRPRIDIILNYWLEMYTCENVSPGKIFSSFKKLGDRYESSDFAEKFVEEMLKDLSDFRKYEQGPRTNTVEDAFHYRAGVMQMAAFTPVLLSLLSWPEEIRIKVLKTLESFLVRRMVCRLTTKDYSRMVLDLVQKIDHQNSKNNAQIIFSFLSSQTAESRRWPTDGDLKEAFLTQPLYRLLTRGRLRLVLEAIEEYYRKDSKTEEKQAPKNLTIEHIMPQGWTSECWPLPHEANEQEEYLERNRLIHTIGNLTLVNNKLNPKLSNAPWTKKKTIIRKHSVLLLSHQLLGIYENEAWTEETIKSRSREMAKIVAKVWPRTDPSCVSIEQQPIR